VKGALKITLIIFQKQYVSSEMGMGGNMPGSRVLHIVDNIAQMLILGTFSPGPIAGSVKFF